MKVDGARLARSRPPTGGGTMARYLLLASYSTEGTQGLLEKGGSARREAVGKLAEGLGGRLESFYFGFGKDDAYVVVDLPDDESAAAASLTVGASGAAAVRTVKLLTPEQIDAAVAMNVTYAKPGS
jgi:uncharacterized protein with GYD domain